MIQFILMLLGLAFSNNNANTAACNNNNQTQTTVQLADPREGLDPGDTGGETGQLPPPPKK
ncbi:hypothetical protein SAMN05421866_2183 [Chryseobacterium oranimense]|uniref:Uncharacterized protein n=1 Tax=Chryseobacterium oranimense TaxID=421058 RepID=A0A1M5QCA5_9FLAO|nr:hypothetical protein [Chryseobacterium oranimense]SHH11578.1 hypothetical protein SAMN05421866_2183 [Chryseobacterium oranimense]